MKNGLLLVFCSNAAQLERALIHSLVNERKVFRGVSVGIPVNVSAESIEENITNAKVSEVKCLKTNRTISLCHHISSA